MTISIEAELVAESPLQELTSEPPTLDSLWAHHPRDFGPTDLRRIVDAERASRREWVGKGRKNDVD